ncbi:MAG TPA: OST-HTH/LOTUS domain-containing protein, partial [Woeseiaceae bacterium]|nr:OST-HTH/LOTUS domain-containing protein [Woeseiaceae bacterium]
YSRNFDGFCIVSSDSDFTRLASRIRETGLIVYGFGEQKTPDAFVSACDKFIFTEVLRAREDEPQRIKKRSSNELKQDAKLINLVRNAIDASSDDDGWADLGPVGSNIAKQSPQFDPRNYGYRKLRDLVAAIKLFEEREKPSKDGQTKSIQVRDIRKK